MVTVPPVPVRVCVEAVAEAKVKVVLQECERLAVCDQVSGGVREALWLLESVGV